MHHHAAWNPRYPLAKQDILSLERVHRRFTKSIHNFTFLTYEQRLKVLNTLSLENSRHIADMVFVFKCLHN